MKAVTYSAEEFRKLSFEPKDLDQRYAHNELPVHYDGLQVKSGKTGIHYWNGLPFCSNVNAGGVRIIAIINPDLVHEQIQYADCMDSASGEFHSIKYLSVTTPVLGMIQLRVDPTDTTVMQLSFVEVHSEYRGQGHLASLLQELVAEMSRNGKKLVRSRVSAFAPNWLKPKIDALLDSHQIPWEQPSGYL